MYFQSTMEIFLRENSQQFNDAPKTMRDIEEIEKK